MSRPSYRISIAALLTVAATALPGQADTALVRRWDIGSTRLFVEGVQLGLDGLNDQLARNGRPTFTDRIPMAGVAASARFGRLLIGAATTYSLPQRRIADGWRTRLTASSVSIDAGVALLETKQMLIHPVVSIGVRRTDLRMATDSAFDFEDGLRDPARSMNLYSLAAFSRFGLAAEQRLSVGAGRLISLGLEAGKAQPFGGRASFTDERSVRGTPSQGSGGYVRFSVGMPLRQRREAFGALGAALASGIVP